MTCTILPPASSDYSAASQEVMFPAGTTQKIVAIPILDNSVLEAKESLSLRATVPASLAGVVLLGTDIATISITDDDSKGYILVQDGHSFLYQVVCDQWFVFGFSSAVSLGFSSPVYEVTESAGSMNVHVVKNGSSDIAISVFLTTSTGTALSNYTHYISRGME